MKNIATFYICYILFNSIQSVPIDNGLAGDPEIKCEQDSMIVVFNTKRDFDGNVYVNGRFNDNGCKVLGNGKTQIQIQVSYSGSCGLRRRRQVSPLGMAVETTVVIMFHKSVMTKVDRAFNIQCFYMQADKAVTTNLEVSMITTIAINSAIRMPNCTYQVLQSPTGPPVKYVNVGDAVYHKWNCVGGDSEMFCITVHSCMVDDGQGQVLTLLDNEGCAQDRYLLQNLEYITDTMAGRESHVFKFADKPTLYFNCQIKLELKENGNGLCPRPKCPELTRGKREVAQILNSSGNSSNYSSEEVASVDVYANKLTVLDIKELDEGSSFDTGELDKKFCKQMLNLTQSEHNQEWCFKPTTGLVSFTLAVCLIFVCGSIFGGSLVAKYKSKT